MASAEWRRCQAKSNLITLVKIYLNSFLLSEMFLFLELGRLDHNYMFSNHPQKPEKNAHLEKVDYAGKHLNLDLKIDEVTSFIHFFTRVRC